MAAMEASKLNSGACIICMGYLSLLLVVWYFIKAILPEVWGKRAPSLYAF